MEQFVDISFVTLGTAALFTAILVCLTVPPKITKKLIGFFAVVTAVSALLVYGYGYAKVDDPADPIVSMVRAAFAVVQVFVGGESWGDIGAAFPHPAQQVVFWMVHLLGLFTSAGAIVTTLGAGIVRWLRLWLLRGRDVSLIYGLNEYTVSFAQTLTEQGKSSIVFVDRNPDPALAAAVEHMGGIMYDDSDAQGATVRFLKRMGIKAGKRRVHVYALQAEPDANRDYARKLLESMKALGIEPEQTALTMLGGGDETDNRLLKEHDRYGYGSVCDVNEPAMTARLLMKHFPPCDTVDFDENGKAVTDFHGLIVGFGQIGQAVLQQLVMSGQFHGSHFRLAVFDPDFREKMGRLAHECAPMFDHYDITFYPHDGRSCRFYDYLDENADSLSYIAVCTGSEEMNTQISQSLRTFLSHRGSAARIYLCGTRGVTYLPGGDKPETFEIYTPEILCTDRMDRMAMVMNQAYSGGGDMRQNWRGCGYFNRMSSRSAADFYPAFLRAAGTTAEQAKQSWDPQGELLENLAKTEHLRWNAFHYAMGFRPMTEEELTARIGQYQAEKRRDPQTKFRITRDMDRRCHACIIPWEELDDYSARENAITGGSRDYKENDRVNVRSVANILRAMDSEA